MLAKSLKLNLSDPENKKLFIHGFLIKTQNLVANYDFLTEKFQCNVVVPKKKVSLASVRNRWKRLLFVEIIKQFKTVGNPKIRLIIRVISNEADPKKLQLEQEIKSIFTQIQKNENYH